MNSKAIPGLSEPQLLWVGHCRSMSLVSLRSPPTSSSDRQIKSSTSPVAWPSRCSPVWWKLRNMLSQFWLRFPLWRCFCSSPPFKVFVIPFCIAFVYVQYDTCNYTTIRYVIWFPSLFLSIGKMGFCEKIVLEVLPVPWRPASGGAGSTLQAIQVFVPPHRLPLRGALGGGVGWKSVELAKVGYFWVWNCSLRLVLQLLHMQVKILFDFRTFLAVSSTISYYIKAFKPGVLSLPLVRWINLRLQKNGGGGSLLGVLETFCFFCPIFLAIYNQILRFFAVFGFLSIFELSNSQFYTLLGPKCSFHTQLRRVPIQTFGFLDGLSYP